MKRAPERQITKDDTEAGTLDEDAAPQGSFQKAPPEVLAKRRILKVRRSLPANASGTTKSNPFASLTAGAPPEEQPAPHSNVPDKDEGPEKTQADTGAPPSSDASVPKPQPGAESAELKDAVKNAASDQEISASATDVPKEDDRSNSELLKPSAENVSKEQSAGTAAPQESSNGPASSKAAEGPSELQDGTQDKEQGSRHDKEQVGGQDKEQEGGQDKEQEDGQDKEQEDGQDKEQEGEQDKEQEGEQDKEQESGKDKEQEGEQDKEQEGGKDKEREGGRHDGETHEGKKGEKQDERKEDTLDGKQESKTDGNAEEKPDVTANEITPATVDKPAEITAEPTSNGKAEEKTSATKGAPAQPTAEGTSSAAATASSKSLPASATGDDTQNGQSKPNGVSSNPPISFGNLSGSTPLTFANAAASDVGAFKFNPAPTSEPKSAPQKDFKEAKVETGEEDEGELFRTRAKLYSLENLESGSRWKERGVGVLKLKVHKEKKTARLLMRTEATLRVILNTPVFAGMKFDPATEKSLRFQGFEKVEKDEKKTLTFLARFTSRDIASGLIAAVDRLESNKEDN